MATIIESKKLKNGTVIRIQKRGASYDVIRNTTGICFMYVEKKVSESRARDTFFLLSLN